MKKHKILIVDDNLKNVQILANFLRDFYSIIFATNGKNAISIVQNKKEGIDLILLDVMMPEIDGFEVCRILKANDDTKSIPIIFVTAKSDQDSIRMGFELGSVDYITKPFNSQELLARVNTHLTLRDYQKDLEERVQREIEERLKQQSILIQQSKMAELGNLIGIISHQWKQPITVLGMLIDILDLDFKNDELTSESLSDFCNQAKEQIQFISHTIDDFKEFFKPSQKKAEFDVKDAIGEILRLFKKMFEKFGITIEIIEREPIKLFGFKNYFKQVVLNLLNNAKDAIIENGRRVGRIVIEIENKTIKFKDNGGGIKEDVIDLLFNNFVSTKGENGTGIGLSMSKKILVDEFNASIYAKNWESGAVFIINFKESS